LPVPSGTSPTVYKNHHWFRLRNNGWFSYPLVIMLYATDINVRHLQEEVVRSSQRWGTRGIGKWGGSESFFPVSPCRRVPVSLVYADSGLGREEGCTNSSAVERFSTISRVTVQRLTSLRDGNSYMTSSISSSTIPRNALAPVLRR